MMKLKPALVSIAMLLPFSLLGAHSYAAPSGQTPDTFFSLSEIKAAGKQELAPVTFIKASDDTSLAYRAYLPQQAKAVVVFYHGAGAHSGLSYNHLGVGLRDEFDIAVYMPDLRGHGSSGGERGDAPSEEQVWADINTMVKQARRQYPNLPIFVGGHSGGAGLALNYSSWDQRSAVDGYVFLAPYFGFRSETNYDDNKKDRFEFSTVNKSDFILNAMSGGLFFGHSKAITFHFPQSVLERNPEIVTFNTVNMSNSVTPHSPDTQLSALQQFGLWIGKQDEAFDPQKVIKFAEKNSGESASKEIAIIDEENHFSIILSGAQSIGAWITRRVEQSGKEH